jgi:hypothetical protein
MAMVEAVNGARMTAEEFRKMLESLGLTRSTAAVVLAVHPRTTRRWANGERAIPGPVNSFLRYLLDARMQAANAPRATQERASKPRAKKIKTNGAPKFNAVGKPYSPQYDPNYKLRHKPSRAHLRWPYPSTMRFVGDEPPKDKEQAP